MNDELTRRGVRTIHHSYFIIHHSQFYLTILSFAGTLRFQ
jgi:hypothetical protein